MKSHGTIETNIEFKAIQEICGKSSFFVEPEVEKILPIPEAFGRGKVHSFRFSDKLGILNTDFISSEEHFIARLQAPRKHIKFSYILSEGQSSVAIEGEKGWFPVGEGESVLLSVPAPMENDVPVGYHLHNICIMVDPQFLQPFKRELSKPATSFIDRILEDDQRPIVNKHSIGPVMQSILRQIQNCPYTGNLKKLYLEGKVLELIAVQLHHLNTQESTKYNNVRLTRLDIDRIRQASELLEHNMQSPPTVDSMAATVGVNVNKLKAGFYQLFDTTVFEYLKKKRLKQALYLLEEDKMRISDIVYEIGYNNLSHFSKAFKKEFGVLPREYRKKLHQSKRPGDYLL